MLKDPLVIRIIGIICILAAIFFGRIWWKHFNKHVHDESAKPLSGDYIYGLSFVFVLLGMLGIVLLYFGKIQ